MLKIKANTHEEYLSFNAEIREYYRVLPAYEEKQWRRITYLLQATTKYEKERIKL